MLGSLLLLGLVGPQFIDVDKARPISVPTRKPPSAEYPLGTDGGGRDVLAVLVVGTPQTLRMGLLAGIVGVVLGTSLGLVAGYFGGRVDMVISTVTDTMLTIPPLAILLVVAASVRTMSVENMALIIALLSWDVSRAHDSRPGLVFARAALRAHGASGRAGRHSHHL